MSTEILKTDPVRKALDSLDQFNHHIMVAQQQRDFFESLDLCTDSQYRITPEAIYVNPGGDPRDVVHMFEHTFDSVFRRTARYSNGAYDWETELHGAVVIIEACEVIDMTGTPIRS